MKQVLQFEESLTERATSFNRETPKVIFQNTAGNSFKETVAQFFNNWAKLKIILFFQPQMNWKQQLKQLF